MQRPRYGVSLAPLIVSTTCDAVAYRHASQAWGRIYEPALRCLVERAAAAMGVLPAPTPGQPQEQGRGSAATSSRDRFALAVLALALLLGTPLLTVPLLLGSGTPLA